MYTPRSRARVVRTDPGWRGLLVGLVAAAAIPAALVAASHPWAAAGLVLAGASLLLWRARPGSPARESPAGGRPRSPAPESD